jgi:hypothetical protein
METQVQKHVKLAPLLLRSRTVRLGRLRIDANGYLFSLHDYPAFYFGHDAMVAQENLVLVDRKLRGRFESDFTALTLARSSMVRCTHSCSSSDIT